MCASKFQVIQDALAGHREVDGDALAALAVLEERLERIRALGGDFSEVGFSSDVRRLRRNGSLAPVG